MAFYDSYNYLSYWQGRGYEDNCERIALEKFFRKITIKKSIIDIGGGFGRLVSVYSPIFEKCIVLDPAEKNLSVGKEKTKNLSNVSFVQGSLPRLSFKNLSFSTALLIRVSHHLPDLVPSFREINRILEKNGFLILEIANKIHFLARARAISHGNFSFVKDLSPLERRSEINIKEDSIAFINHHPQKVMEDLKDTGFLVREILSVSNFRSPIIKKIIPEKILLSLEKAWQKPLAKSYFGPSIFILAQKNDS